MSQDKDQQHELPEMPSHYLNNDGVVVDANPILHRMVVQRKGSYGTFVPCDEKGNPTVGGGVSADAELQIAELEDQIADLKLKGDQAYNKGLADGNEDAEADAQERIDQAYQNGLKDGREESARLAEKAEAEAKDGEKPAAKKATAKRTSDKKSEG